MPETGTDSKLSRYARCLLAWSRTTVQILPCTSVSRRAHLAPLINYGELSGNWALNLRLAGSASSCLQLSRCPFKRALCGFEAQVVSQRGQTHTGRGQTHTRAFWGRGRQHGVISPAFYYAQNSPMPRFARRERSVLAALATRLAAEAPITLTGVGWRAVHAQQDLLSSGTIVFRAQRDRRQRPCLNTLFGPPPVFFFSHTTQATRPTECFAPCR